MTGSSPVRARVTPWVKDFRVIPDDCGRAAGDRRSEPRRRGPGQLAPFGQIEHLDPGRRSGPDAGEVIRRTAGRSDPVVHRLPRHRFRHGACHRHGGMRGVGRRRAPRSRPPARVRPRCRASPQDRRDRVSGLARGSLTSTCCLASSAREDASAIARRRVARRGIHGSRDDPSPSDREVPDTSVSKAQGDADRGAPDDTPWS